MFVKYAARREAGPGKGRGDPLAPLAKGAFVGSSFLVMGGMDMASRAEVLRSSVLFDGLSDRECMAAARELGEIRVGAGEYVFRAGDAGDRMFVVASGLLRILLPQPDGREVAINEAGRGDTLGEIALLMGSERSASAVAIRDTHLLTISRDSFDRFVERWPKLALALARQQVGRLHRAQGAFSATSCRVIAVVPAGGGRAGVDFGAQLAQEISRHGTCHHEGARMAAGGDQAVAARSWAERMDAMERQNRFLVLDTERVPGEWTRLCTRRADTVILVGEAGAEARRNEVEAHISASRGGAGGPQIHLVLLRTGGAPQGAGEWLRERGVTMHHHAREGDSSDVARIARFLAGRAHGLVLGGGGARGFAHIGALRALREAGQPVDAVGGTSMGALVAAMAAIGMNGDAMVEACIAICIRRGVLDYTMPLVSLVAGRRLTQSLGEVFGSTLIEDLPINFFCMTANLVTAEPVVHQRGPVARWVRTSMSLPGVAPPLVEDGHLYCDGGVIDNLPVERMEALTPGNVTAVDVSPKVDLMVDKEWPELVRPWDFLRRGKKSFPNIFQVLQRSAVIGSQRALDASAQRAQRLIQPPVSGYGLFQWDAIHEIVEAGYAAAKVCLERREM